LEETKNGTAGWLGTALEEFVGDISDVKLKNLTLSPSSRDSRYVCSRDAPSRIIVEFDLTGKFKHVPEAIFGKIIGVCEYNGTERS
jgi:hypothetical protein